MPRLVAKMEGMKEAKASVTDLIEKNKNSITVALRGLAISSSAELRKNIAAGRTEPLSDGTRRKRMLGKEQGADWPPIPAYGGKKPLNRSGALAQAIDYMQMAPFRFVVGVAAAAKTAFSGGAPLLPLSWIAALLETGFVASLPLTTRMNAYLLALYGEITKKPSSHLFNQYVGRNIIVYTPSRPIFTQTFNSIAERADERVSDRFCDLVLGTGKKSKG